MENICAGHGGVNCSILNKATSIVCNDGTIDESLSTIYAIPQCQKTIEDIATQQSDFMAKSGCFPPSEMTCTNDLSYQNLFKHLNASGSAYSELGKNELAQCRKQISDYTRDNKNYKQCLINHGQPQFEPSGRIVLPILKAAFCPLFYGGNASYDFETDLCLCDAGYFIDSEKCVEANNICQSKYGYNVFAKNGNCSRPSLVQASNPTKTPSTKSEPIESVTNSRPNPPMANVPPQITQTPYFSTQPEVENNFPKTNTNLITVILSGFISGFKNILRLF